MSKTSVTPCCVALVLLLLLPASGWAQQTEDSTESLDSPQEALARISAKLADGSVAIVKILNIPADYHAGGSVTPRYFDKVADYQLRINLSLNKYAPQLAGLVSATRVSSHTGYPKIRWGIIFYNWKDERLGAIYFDGNGLNGVVNNSPVQFTRASRSLGLFKEPSVYDWLVSNFSCAFQ